MSSSIARLSTAGIEAALSRIDPVFLDSPQFPAEMLDEPLGCRMVVKVETLNPIRSFKGRGACSFVAQHDPARPLVCASAGNFGQAMAWACRARGLPLVVFAAHTANPLKLDRMRALGADVRLAGEDFDAAKLAAKAYAAASGACMVEDGDAPTISEGAGTIALELTRRGPPVDAVVVPLGNGALLNGIGTWYRAAAPTVEVIGVVAAGATSMRDSWRDGRIVTYDRIDTIADGIGVRVPIPAAVDDMRHTTDDVLVVDDATIRAAMRLAHQTLGLVLEPSGAAGIAALLAHRERFAGRTVAAILCGGNVALQRYRDWLF